MLAVERTWDKFRGLVNFLCEVFCVVLIAALDIQIFSRFFLGRSTTWSEELAELCFTGIVFCYLAQAEKDNAHLQLEIIFQIWPKTKKILMITGKVICCVYSMFVIYSETKLLPTITKLTTPACHIPLRWVHLLILIGSAMWIVQTIISIIDIVKEGKEEHA